MYVGSPFQNYWANRDEILVIRCGNIEEGIPQKIVYTSCQQVIVIAHPKHNSFFEASDRTPRNYKYLLAQSDSIAITNDCNCQVNKFRFCYKNWG